MLQGCATGVNQGLGPGRVRALIPAGVEGIGRPLLTGAAKVINQQVAGQGRDPRGKAALGGIEAAQVAVDLDEDVLCQIFRIMRGSGEAVAERVDPALLGGYQLRPRGGIAIEAALDQGGKIDLRRIRSSFRGPLPARAALPVWRRVRSRIQSGRSSGCRIAPPGIGLKAFTACTRSPVVQN